MGFSVSGSFAIVVLASLIALGTVYPAVANSFEDIRDAQRADQNGALERQNTELNLTSATWDASQSQLVIEVENEGTTELVVNATDIIIDNTYVTHERLATDENSSETIDGDATTELWLPAETYNVTVSETVLEDLGIATPPDRVKIVTGPGVSDAVGVA